MNGVQQIDRYNVCGDYMAWNDIQYETPNNEWENAVITRFKFLLDASDQG